MMTNKEREDALQLLHDLERGKFLPSFGGELRHLVEAVRCAGRNGASGTMTVTLKFALTDLDSGELDVQSTIKTSPPQTPKARTIFFANTDGSLSRRDPRQSDLEELPQVRGRKEG